MTLHEMFPIKMFNEAMPQTASMPTPLLLPSVFAFFLYALRQLQDEFVHCRTVRPRHTLQLAGVPRALDVSKSTGRYREVHRRFLVPVGVYRLWIRAQRSQYDLAPCRPCG